MGIMGCYPDKRAVENELGGKWEILYEYTFEETSKETFEFPHDLDENESPLNINGLKILVTGSGGINEQLYINGKLMVSDATTLTNNSVGLFAKVMNGHLFGFFKARSTSEYSVGTMYTTNSMLFTECDSITSFTYALTGSSALEPGTKITFYVLRGV